MISIFYFLAIAVTNHNHAECPQDNITVLNIKILDIDKSPIKVNSMPNDYKCYPCACESSVLYLWVKFDFLDSLILAAMN
jgi:hypothetical protein